MNDAAKKTAATLIETHRQLADLRKAVREAKTNVNALKRNVEFYSTILDRPFAKESLAGYQDSLARAEVRLMEAQKALAHAEANQPPRPTTGFEAILKWFGGTALTNAQDALELLGASLSHGSWLPGASRKVRAAVGKPNIAKKTIHIEKGYDLGPADSAIRYAIEYGSFNQLAALTSPKGLKGDTIEFYRDFKPLVDTMDRLDATRPVPTFTELGASPTVTATLQSFEATRVTVCPMERRTVEYLDEKGKKAFRTVVILRWPPGTRHNTSRYAGGTSNNQQCHACGHAIRNPFNWVPMVLWDKKKNPRSLWVGRDCAETLFGVKLTGELEIKEWP